MWCQVKFVILNIVFVNYKSFSADKIRIEFKNKWNVEETMGKIFHFQMTFMYLCFQRKWEFQNLKALLTAAPEAKNKINNEKQ
jgi:hypothetical protein